MVSKHEKDLTWKYFLQQKFYEISITILIITAIVFIPFLLGHNIGDNISEFCGNSGSYYYPVAEECGIIVQWFEGLGYAILGVLSLVFAFFVLNMIRLLILYWIETNWDKATDRAKKEIRNIKKGRKGK